MSIEAPNGLDEDDSVCGGRERKGGGEKEAT